MFLALVLFAASQAHAEKRVALVIGNAAYKNAATLLNPRNDAQDVSAALRRIGFETIVGLDLDKAGMEDRSISFARAARDADVALVYYNGHAMQFGGFNYLMPVDAALHDEADLRRLTRVDEIVAALKQAKNLRILVLDACRDNPLADELSRSMEASRGLTVDRGLARIIPPSGMIISYATQAGRTAADGRGRNSPYTMAFLKNIEATEEIGVVFRNITSDVYAATDSKQLPELSLSLIGNFYLKGRPEPTTGATPTGEAERAWTAAQNTTSQAVLEEYIKHYGDSFYGALARARLDELKKGQVAVVAPVAEPQPSTRPVQNTQVAVVAPPVAPAAPTFSHRPCGAPLTVLTVSLLTRSPQPLSAAEECALKPKDMFNECEKCPEMIVVPAGSFTMGSPNSEPGRNPIEGPQHTVTIAKPFAVGKFTVTVDQFAAFVRETGYDAASKCNTGEGGTTNERSDRSFSNPGFPQTGSHPAVCVNWDDANAYVAWLSKNTGKPYRLLAEAEWEYAARAGTTTKYFWGDDIGNGNANCVGCGSQWDKKQTAPVGSFKPNAFGLYDMHGNVWQWLEDCFHGNYEGAPTDGSAWISSADCGFRLSSGGAWNIHAWYLRASARYRFPSAFRLSWLGLRVARTLTP
jgi:formylglycine-generating enzyme required for sulfatase activity